MISESESEFDLIDWNDLKSLFFLHMLSILWNILSALNLDNQIVVYVLLLYFSNDASSSYVCFAG